MIEKIQEATKELTTSLLTFQKKYEASFPELKQVVSYSLDSISSPQPGTGTAIEDQGRIHTEEKASTGSKHSSPTTDIKTQSLHKAPPSPIIKPSND
jgi:hypothetical protein